jgi:hypothetical protein
MSALEQAPPFASSRRDATEAATLPSMRGTATVGTPSPEYGADSLAGLSEARA